MKKYLLFIISMLCVSIGTWAQDPTATISGGSESLVIITTNGDADLSTLSGSTALQGNWGCYNPGTDNGVKVSGTITQAGLDVINSMMSTNSGMYYLGDKYLYLNEATLSGTISSLPAGSCTSSNNVQIRFAYCILPAETEMPTTIPSTYEYVYSGCESDGTIRIHVNQENASISQFTAAQISAANTIIVTGSAKDNFISSMTDEAKAKLAFDGSASITTTSSSNVQAQLEAYLISKGKTTSSATTEVVSLTISGPLTSEDVTYLSALSGLTTLNLTSVTSFGSGVSKSTINAAVSGATVIYPAAYTVSGCDVTVNALGSDMSTILTEAKAAVVAGGQSHICTLTVIGELKNADLAVLGDAAMTGATRIDLSGGTLATGASIDNLQLPSSLTSLVLPKDQTVSSVLAGKLEAAGNVNYAYSPSSDAQHLGANSTSSYNGTKNKIADYVWVVKAGGLAQAFTNEEWLRNSFYIKVASSVALNQTDVNFNALDANKPTNYLFLDFSESNLTPEMATNYRVTDDIGYRIILPDNWTLANMAVFANLTVAQRGNMAAVYSYEGTKLNILEITDGNYSDTALKNPRIVREGTTAIEVLGELIDNGGGSYTQHGDLGNNLIAALNQADDDPDDDAVNNIKTININVGLANTILTTISFTNTNIEHFTMAGVKNKNNPGTGPGVDVSQCTNLQTIDVSNSTLQLLDAHGLTNLTSVNMSGTLMTNASGLSGETILTGCTSLTTSGFVTTNTTQFIKDLKLINTGLTSFATPAKVTGDIYLNASTSLTSLDLTTTQFQNTTSKIHIHATDNEEDNTPISGLNNGSNKTISVTNKFNGENNASPRIHPFTDIADNISEAAASGEASGGIDGCTNNECKITYNAATGVATVHAVHAGHFAALMRTNYAGYPQGTTFKFDKDCVLNLDDLKALCGTILNADNSTYNDMNWRSNFYYVDLYDVPATEALCKSATFENNVKTAEGGVIYQWIEWMREYDRQVKGLILPKDHTLYGAGISLIQSENPKTQGELSTCSEFIAYFKTQNMDNNVVTNLPKKILFTHVYNAQAGNSAAIQASNDKLTELLTAHGLNGAATNCPVDLYSVSTNGVVPFDATTLVGGKGYVETFNNEMVGPDTRANIYAYPSAAGEFTTFVDYSSIGVTTTEVLKIDGTVSSDASAVAASINRFTNGPRVLDLKKIEPNSDEFLSALLSALTNSNIEYIILPGNKSKSLVCGTSYTNMANLKAVISSTSTNLVAYIDEEGSLAEARYLATGGSVTPGTPNIYSPAKVGLTSVTLAGTLNAADIGCNLTTYHTDANGHWKNTSGDEASVGLSMETGITSIDLADAVFVNKATDKTTNPVAYADMNLSWAGLANLSDIKLPTSTEMKDIPESCCEGLASLKEICIPHNYEKIHNAAFLNTIVEHITTTDAAGTLVDNGPNTYTLSANLKQVGDAPADNNVGLTATQTVFPQNRPVFDCYVLATKTPICYKNAFPANMLYGWGGFDGTLPYCRDKYVNGTNYYCVLRFPSQESYDATVADKRDTSYDLMKKQYTDVNKVYTKKEQTGAVDANGEEIVWPTFSELRRAYNQATNDNTWNDWTTTYDINHEVNGGDNIPTTSQPAGGREGDYDFSGYEGWHQFTLSQATYVEPDEVNPETREYVDAGWFTFCIPYDMTMKQVREWLGVPASEGNVHCYYNNAEVTTPMLPDVRMLASVTRHTSTGAGNNNKVTFRLSTNLVSAEAGHYLNFDRTAAASSRWNTADAAGQASYDSDSKPCLVGGIPYIIKAYKRKGEKIKSYNLGQYIMTRYGDQFKLTQACLNRGVKYYEYLGTTGGNIATLKFSKPYEDAIVVAVNDAPSGGYCTYMDGDNTRDYEYALVGTFWDQKLPRYCFYQSKGKWYRNTNVNDYKWSAYKCVIMAVPYKAATSYSGYDGHNGQFYRENPSALGIVQENKSFYPSIETNTTDKLNGTLKIVFADGRDDDDFPAAAARYSFAFDDDIVEYDDMGNEATAIDKLDCEDITPLPNNYKVYNMSGQYVGNSVNGLAKGMYVVNGKKYVIK